MTEHQAQQIAELINNQNQLVEKYSTADILGYNGETLFYSDSRDKIVCVLQVRKVQWCQTEIEHLSVHIENRRSGWARRLLAEAEQAAKRMGARVIQCTVRDNNEASTKLFFSAGYKQTNLFLNPESGNKVRVYQKVL